MTFIATGSATDSILVKKPNGGGLLLSGLSSAISLTDATWTVDTTVDQTFSITAQFGGLFIGTSITTKLVQINLT